MLNCNHFIQLLVGCEAKRIDIHSVPVVENSANLYIQASGGDGLDENSSSFKFTPQRIRLDIDDEMFANNNLNRSLQKAESLDNIKLQSGKTCGISTFQGQKASRHMDGDVHRHMYLQDLVTPLTEESPALNIAEFQCHIAGCKQLFDTLEGYEHHYNSLHRHVCSSCKRSFPSNRLLDIHILEWHDSLFQVMAERESMYQCLVEGCGLKFQDSKERKEHLVTTHSYPSDFRFDKTKKIKRGTKEEKFPQQKKLDNCEDMDFSLPQETESHNHDLPERQKPHYSYKVPPTICFGHGSVRGFRGGRKKK